MAERLAHHIDLPGAIGRLRPHPQRTAATDLHSRAAIRRRLENLDIGRRELAAGRRQQPRAHSFARQGGRNEHALALPLGQGVALPAHGGGRQIDPIGPCSAFPAHPRIATIG